MVLTVRAPRTGLGLLNARGREFLGDSRKYFLSVALTAGASLVAVPVVTRVMTVPDYGQYLILFAAVGLLSTASVGWITPAIVRFWPSCRTVEEQAEIHASTFKVGLLAMTTTALISGTALVLSDSPLTRDLPAAVLAWVIAIAESVSALLLNVLRSRRALGWYLFFTIWCNVGRLVLGVLLVMLAGLGVYGMLGGWLLALATALPAMLVVSVGRMLPQTVRTPIVWPRILEMARFGVPVMMMTFLVWVLSVSDRYILAVFRGAADVGMYAASYELSERSLFQIISIFTMAGGPLVVNAWEREGESSSRALVEQITTYYVALALPATVAMSVLAEPIAQLLLPVAYQSAFGIIPVVAAGTFLWGLMHSYAYGLVLHRKTSLQLLCLACAAALNLGLNLWFVPRYGYWAAAWSTLASYGLALVAVVAVSRRFFRWDFPVRILGHVLLAAAVMAASSYVASHSSRSAWVNVSSGAAVAVITYLAVLLGTANASGLALRVGRIKGWRWPQ